MATERRSIAVFDDAAALDAFPGPRTVKYARLVSNGALYEWRPGDTTAADNDAVIEHTGGFIGRWHAIPGAGGGAVKGADLTDADATIVLSGGSWRKLPDATLSDHRVLTLGSTGAAPGSEIAITRFDTEPFSYTIRDQASSADLSVFDPSQQWYGEYRFDGTNWERKFDAQLA